MPRRPKRRRPSVPFAWLLWIALAANVAAGLAFSPVTSIRKLRVMGAPESAYRAVRALAASLRNKPGLAADFAEFESAVQLAPEVRSSNVRFGLFGTATLEIRRRRPAARVEGRPRQWIDSDGVAFESASALDPGVSFAAPDSLTAPVFSVCGSWPSVSVAEICLRTKELGLPGRWTVEIEVSGSVSLREGSQARIALGRPERLDEKFSALRRIIRERPGILGTVKELNLTSPGNPSVRP